MRVLELFAGIGSGTIAMERAGVKITKVYASEINKSAIAVNQHHHPDTVQLGNILKWRNWGLQEGDIDIMFAGSSCQNLSVAGKQEGLATVDKIEITSLEQYRELRKAGHEFKGQSWLFWEMIEIFQVVKPRYFIVENVQMKKKWQEVFTKYLGVNPRAINSNLFSAQNRNRLYWSNIKIPPRLPKDKEIVLKDVLEYDPMTCTLVDPKHFKDVDFTQYICKDPTGQVAINYSSSGREGGRVESRNYLSGDKKAHCLVAGGYTTYKSFTGVVIANVADLNPVYGKTYVQYDTTGKGHRSQGNRAYYLEGKMNCLPSSRTATKTNVVLSKELNVRKLSPVECERLQTLDDNYTSIAGSDEKRYKLLGNGWTVDVVAWILKPLAKQKRYQAKLELTEEEQLEITFL